MNDTRLKLPSPPYYAVIFTAQHTGADADQYDEIAGKMFELAAEQPGFLGYENYEGDDGVGINVSYWEDEASIKAWKQVADHKTAQAMGKAKWYQWFELRVAKVERAYSFDK